MACWRGCCSSRWRLVSGRGKVIPIGEVTSSLDVLKELPDHVEVTFALAQETTYHLEWNN